MELTDGAAHASSSFPAAGTRRKRKDDAPGSIILFWIGAFKLFKCVMLLIVGIAALRLAHGNMLEILSDWAYRFRVDPDNRFVHHLIGRLFATDPRKLDYLAIGTFIYAAVFATEGTGLLLRKRWAEYFTVISTSLLIPLEIYEIFHHLTAIKILVLLINIVIVIYLIIRVRQKPSSSDEPVAHPA